MQTLSASDAKREFGEVLIEGETSGDVESFSIETIKKMHKELAQASAEIDQGKISPLNIKEITEHVFGEQRNKCD